MEAISPKIQATPMNMVYPRQAIDYKAFKEKFSKDEESELHSLEKFYATRRLIEQGCSRIFINATLIASTAHGNKHSISADVCGECNDHIVVAFCETTQPTRKLHGKLRLVGSAESVRVVLLYPFTVDIDTLVQWFPKHFESGKFAIEQVPWLSDEAEGIFEDALELVMLLGNRTRVRMLLPLLKEPRRKRHFRTRINPKLVYENISTLMAHRLVDELTKGEYALTPIGRQILCEYLAFLQRVKKTLETYES